MRRRSWSHTRGAEHSDGSAPNGNSKREGVSRVYRRCSGLLSINLEQKRRVSTIIPTSYPSIARPMSMFPLELRLNAILSSGCLGTWEVQRRTMQVPTPFSKNHTTVADHQHVGALRTIRGSQRIVHCIMSAAVG